MTVYKHNMPNGLTGKENRSKRGPYIIRAVVFLLMISVGVAFWYAINEYQRKPVCVTDSRAEYELDATKLITEFEENAAESEKKYMGKILKLTGVINAVEITRNAISISFNNESSSSSVRCSIDSTEDKRMLKEGMSVSLKGIYVGFNRDSLLGSDVVMNRCVLVNK